jgi:hypothetical protein
MSNLDTKLRNEVLDDIIILRRTIRTFGPDAPGEDMVLQLIRVGLHAPYTKAAVENFTEGYFRRFFVIRQGSDSMAMASAYLDAKVKELAGDLKKKARQSLPLKKKAAHGHGVSNGFKTYGIFRG